MRPLFASALEEELATCPSAPAGSTYEGYKALTAHDARLHALILRIAGNLAVEQAFVRTHCHLHFFRLSYNQPFGEQAIVEHRALVAALVAGRREEARDAMTHHLETARDRLLQRF
jgi:DNA-binding GntR family transcriptional regulator